jgi:hypothetical protein
VPFCSRESFLPRGPAQAATELLEPENLRLGGPQHHHRVEGWKIDAFVEDVHAKNDIEVALFELLERQRARRGGVA